MNWIQSYFQTNCKNGGSGCQTPFIKKGDTVLWDKKAGVVYCKTCGEQIQKGINDGKTSTSTD